MNPVVRVAPCGLLAASLAAQCGSTWLPGDVAGVSTATGDLGTVSATTAWDPDGPGPAVPVAVLAGDFAQIGHQTCRNLVRWDPGAGAFADVGGGTDAPIEAVVALPGGDLVVAGRFTSAGGVAANHVARFDGTAFHALGAGLDGAVHALCVLANGDLVAGGAFHASGGVATDLIARWDGAAWSPLPGLAGPTAQVHAICQAVGGDIYAGGTLSGGNLQRWDGTAWAPLGAGTSNAVRALLPLPTGEVVVAGVFSTAGGLASRGIARWDGAQWIAFPGLDNAAYALHREPNGDIVVGGRFATAGSTYAPGVVRWDGSTWQPMSYGLSGGLEGVRALARVGAQLVAGGNFGEASPNGSARGAARWDGTAWFPLAVAFDNTVSQLIDVGGGALVALGSFRSTPGGVAPSIARYDGGVWTAVPDTGLVGLLYAPGIALHGGDLVVTGYQSNQYLLERFDGLAWTTLGYVGGRITALCELANGDLIVADATGGLQVLAGGTWTPMASPGVVADLVVKPDGHVLAAISSFGTAGFLMEWDGSSWSAVGGPRTGTARTVLLRRNGDVVVGGRGLDVGGGVNGVGVWDGQQWSTPAGGVAAASSGSVFDLAELPNGDLIAGGDFALAGGAYVHCIARCDGVAWAGLGFGLTTNSPIYPAQAVSLAVLPDGTLCVGGFFARAGNTSATAFARFATSCPASAASLPMACSGSSGPLLLVADTLPWLGGTFRAAATGFASNALGVALVGLQDPAQPLSLYFPTASSGCDLRASPDAILLALPTNGAANYAFAIPNAPLLARLPLWHQFLQLELTAQGGLGPVSGSNALALVLGSL